MMCGAGHFVGPSHILCCGVLSGFAFNIHIDLLLSGWGFVCFAQVTPIKELNTLKVNSLGSLSGVGFMLRVGD